MVKKVKITKRLEAQATDYLSRVNLEITDEDLSSKPLVKKIIQELKEVKADNLGLLDTLQATQNALETKKQELSEIDKENAVLKAVNKPRKGLAVVRDLSLVGLGGGLGLVPVSAWVACGLFAVSLVVYGLTSFYEK